MTQEEKQLLIKALCGYFPYGVICSVVHKKDGRLVEEDMKLSGMFEDGNLWWNIDEIEFGVVEPIYTLTTRPFYNKITIGESALDEKYYKTSIVNL